MPRLLCYGQEPVALIEWLPNNAFGPIPEFAEGEVCSRISPDEGACDVIEISPEEADRLRRGEPLDLVGRFPDYDEDPDDESDDENWGD